MPRFFVGNEAITESEGIYSIVITGDDARHISRVLRVRPGEELTVCDGNEYEYISSVVSVGDEVRLMSSKRQRITSEPPYTATVFQALVKGERFDLTVQKSTELGAGRIVPFSSRRCTVKLDEKEYPKKTERWQRIADEAGKQCGRGVLPEVTFPMTFREMLDEASKADLVLFCYEGDTALKLPEALKKSGCPGSVSVIIGPEGGFETTEVDEAEKRGMKPVGLGSRILRTETAAPFVLSCLSYEFEIGR